jgi:hypothetical protein
MVFALAIFIAAAGLCGCSSTGASDGGVAIASSCEGAGAGADACQASDNARQLRDAAAYQNEPELGYVKSPPGMLPMPTTSKNSPL